MDSALRKNIERLINEKTLTDYRIAKESGVSLTRIRAIRKGEADIDKVTLINAEKLSDFWEGYKDE